ncbi:MAG: hypothetical protein JSW54_10595 [Fidelibacterota bacterium]|nr:MAG: hypothetical protein JSW54_10595 [Candidatus Neomarinimicrobiota bacterium]
MQIRTLAVILILTLLFPGSGCILAQDSLAQTIQSVPPINLAGPRVGITIITGESARTLKDELDAAPIVTQFGWQLEHRFFTVENGPTGLTEFVLLIGGIEQGIFLPSISWLVGLRMPSGSEFALGPNLSVGGAAYAVAFGITKQYGALNVPINLAAVLSKNGIRISLLAGFNAKAQAGKGSWLWSD